jgi:hypothetical protein
VTPVLAALVAALTALFSSHTAASIQRQALPHHQALPHITAFGDSVMLGAKPRIRQAFGGRVDAVESRQADETLTDVRRAAAAGALNPLVVVHVGTNGTIDPHQLETTLRKVSDLPRVKVIEVLTVHVPRSWEAPDNSIIRRVVPGIAKAVIAPWKKAADAHPGWLYSDRTHLTPAGQAGYTHLLETTYRQA